MNINDNTQNFSCISVYSNDEFEENLNKNINDETSFNWSKPINDTFDSEINEQLQNKSLNNNSHKLNATEPVLATQHKNVKRNRTTVDDNLEDITEFDASIDNTPTNTNITLSFAAKINDTTSKMITTTTIDAFETNDDDEKSVTMSEVPELLDENLYFTYPLLEVGRKLWPSSTEAQHYTKACIFSPDGTCILVPVHMDGMHVIEVPTDLYTLNSLDAKRKVSDLETAVHVKEGGTVYDVAWYPFMNSHSPETCFWLATRQHEPIHMWDAFNGELRCSYRGYDDVDEVESAITIKFSNDGEKIFAGYKKSIKIFNTNIPGRDYDKFSVKQAVSSIALAQDNDYHCITTGSWNGYIQHYDLRLQKHGALFTLGGHTAGITWLRYISNKGNKMLFSGARKDNQILQWDMRNFKQPVNIYKRDVDTNQRIYFDISQEEQWLISGDTKGNFHAWNLNENYEYKTQLHDDCCNCVNFHNSIPIIASSSGQYHFANLETEVALTAQNEVEEDCEFVKEVPYENALLLLWYGKNKQMA